LNAGLLARGLVKKGIYQAQPGWGRFGMQLGCATLVLGLVLFALDHPLADSWQGWAWWQRLPVLGGICAAGFAAYIAVLYALGLRIRHLRAPAG
jgi:putative peptidoglycan lipid II flippase